MVMKYMLQAMGDGDLKTSAIFQQAFDWLFQHIAVIGDNVEEEEFEGIPATTVTGYLVKPFDLSKYELLHDFMLNESVLLTEPSDNGDPEGVQQTSYGYGPAFADQLAHFTMLWVKNLKGLTGAEEESLRQLSKFITTGMLNEFFKLPMKEGLFEAEFVRRCTTPELET